MNMSNLLMKEVRMMNAEIKVGTVTVVLPEGLELPEKAGSLKDKEVRRMVRVRRGLGRACRHTAVQMTKSAPGFAVPGLEPERLEELGRQAEVWDTVITDLEIALGRARQANLLVDAAAYNALRRVNNQVKAIAPFDAGVRVRLSAVVDYFKRAPRQAKAPRKGAALSALPSGEAD
jgi:hypothetical protein